VIRVLFFGPIAERVQAREMQLAHTAGMKLHDLIAQLSTRHPEAFGIVSFIAVNQAQIHDKHMLLNDNDEIAFMAKFSGG
jgi:molybdopterin converting factor small subunit